MESHFHNVIPPATVKLLLICEAPPPADKPENYFYNVTDGFSVDGRKRSFFRELMKGVGLISENASLYNEKVVLDAFLAAGYFLVDTCPTAIVGTDKKAFMLKSFSSLRQAIMSLNPEKIIFVCKTNEAIIERLKEDREIYQRLVALAALPYPGNGQQVRFRNEFPKAYKLNPVY
jgi:hypothetical protein